MRRLFEVDLKDYDGCSKVFRRPSARAIIFKGDKIALVYAVNEKYYKFPGGGIHDDEDKKQALIREVREESGLNVIPESIKEFGSVLRRQKSDRDEDTIFEQENYYYLCETEGVAASQNLDDYEKEAGFELVYVDIDEAIKVNGEYRSDVFFNEVMIGREKRVLELIKADMEKKSSAVLYVHGKGGHAQEAEHYKTLFPDMDVIGLDYKTDSPWETNKEIEEAVASLREDHDSIILIANSIGAFYSMNADISSIDHAFFISPMADMEKLITDMMTWSGVTEDDLKREKVIKTDFGENLSWEYLSYVRDNPVSWTVPTDILYGSADQLQSYETIKAFADRTGSSLTVMHGGEHWFHTEEQMKFLDEWITNIKL